MMKRLKEAVLFLIIISLFLPTYCYAHDKKGHNADLEEVLLGTDYKLSSNHSAREVMDIIEAALYLSIDQFNGDGEEELKLLQGQDIGGIPDDLSEIDFTSNSLHRSFTHRGWDFVYTHDVAHWNIRKELLLNTVNSQFDFGKLSNAVSGFDKKCNSFAALMYYIHIIGDHIEDKSFRTGDLKIGLGGRNDEDSIISELIKHSNILFDDSKARIKKAWYIHRLKALDKQIKKVVQSKGGINTPEIFEKYHSYAEELLTILKEELPELLFEEPFFHDEFYA